MNDKRGRLRLEELFSSMEMLVDYAAWNPRSRHPESEDPPSQVGDIETAVSENEALQAEAETPVNLQVEQLNTDGISLLERDQLEYVDSNDRVELSPDSILSIPEIAQPVPAPVIARAAPPSQGQLPGSQESPANWQGVVIGAITGAIVTGIIVTFISQLVAVNNFGRFAILGWEVFCGILGALMAGSTKPTRRDIWMGAIQGALVPVWIMLVLGLLLYLLVFTNIMGV